MMEAKLIENENSQAVSLPDEYRFDSDEVKAGSKGDTVTPIPPDPSWSGFLNSLDMFSDEFMSDGRSQDTVQERDGY